MWGLVEKSKSLCLPLNLARNRKLLYKIDFLKKHDQSPERIKLKRVATINVGEQDKLLEFSYTAGGSVTWYNFGKMFGSYF